MSSQIESHLEALEEQTYRIERVYQATAHHEIVRTGLTREEAQEHYSDPDTQGGVWPDVWMDVMYPE